MEFVSGAISWLSTNESALSGLAALIVVTGVVFTPIGAGLRRYLSGRSSPPPTPLETPATPLDATPPAEEPAVGATQAPAPTRPSIAVLPFQNMSSDAEQEYLADGMTEDLITGLSANRQLHVVARNSTFAYKGQSPDIRQVGRELGVRYVLEGSVRRVGDRMRTTVQLIEAESGAHLWAEKYDRPFESMFEVQDEVVASISGALQAQLSSAEYERVRSAHPASLGAWELVQKAFSHMVYESPSVEMYRHVVSELRAAVELEPDYAYARAAYAWVLQISIINGFTREIEESLRIAKIHLKKALEGGVQDPLTLYYAGAAYLYRGQFEKAISTLNRSLALNPNQPDAILHLALAHGYLSHFTEAHRHFDRGEALAPTGGFSGTYGWYRGIVLGFQERYEEAIALIRGFLEHAPSYAAARIVLGLDLYAIGQVEEARGCIERACREDPDVYLEGLVLNIGAHPTPAIGAERVRLLREFWPAG